MVKLSENVWPLLIGRRSNLVIIREAKLRKRRRTSSLKFLPWNTNFPWKEASIRITRVCFHQRNLKFFTDKTWKNGTEEKGFFRRRISNSISNPRKCTYRGIWRRLRRVNRYVSTIYLHFRYIARETWKKSFVLASIWGELWARTVE